MSAQPDPSPSARLAALTECEQLFLALHGYIDDGVATQGLDLFTDDGVFEVRGQQHAGRAAIAEFLRVREAAAERRTRHLASNFRFTLDATDQAHASANLTLFTIGHDNGALELEAVVDCELVFVRGDGGTWRISQRRHRRFASTGNQ